MKLESWKTTLLLSHCFFISITAAVTLRAPAGDLMSYKLGLVLGYFISMMLKSAGSALLAFLISGRRIPFFLAMSIAVLALMVNQISADALSLAW